MASKNQSGAHTTAGPTIDEYWASNPGRGSCEFGAVGKREDSGELR